MEIQPGPLYEGRISLEEKYKVMKTRQISIGDGRMVAVDEARFGQLEAAIPFFKQHLAMDSQEALFFIVSQLAYTESRVFETLGVPMQFRDALAGCITSEAGEWADSIRFEVIDGVARGKRISGKGHDINEVDVSYADESMPVYQGGIGYSYTTEELRRTAYLRRPLPELKLRLAMEGFERHINQTALYGEQDLPGLCNSSVVPQANAPNGGWIAGYASSPTTYPAKILQDLNNGCNVIWNSTNFNDLPTDIAIAPTLWEFLTSTYATQQGFLNKNLLDLFLEQNLVKAQTGKSPNVYPGYELDTAGVGGATRIVYYVKNPDRVILHLPMPLRFLAPQLVALDVKIPGEYKYSGVIVRYPKAAYYQDGE